MRMCSQEQVQEMGKQPPPGYSGKWSRQHKIGQEQTGRKTLIATKTHFNSAHHKRNKGREPPCGSAQPSSCGARGQQHF